jgi:ABC-type sugar transport system substrate-binding protein
MLVAPARRSRLIAVLRRVAITSQHRRFSLRRAAGRQVPGDVALVGFDDIEDSRFSTPTLTTVRPDKQQIARLAVSFLLSRIADGLATPPREVQVGYEPVVRESTTGAARREPRTTPTTAEARPGQTTRARR